MVQYSSRSHAQNKDIQAQPLWSANNAAPQRAGMSVAEAEHENVICHFYNILQPWLQDLPMHQAFTFQMFGLSWLLGTLPLSN